MKKFYDDNEFYNKEGKACSEAFRKLVEPFIERYSDYSMNELCRVLENVVSSETAFMKAQRPKKKSAKE
jgi:hypothetical protein